jgi:hypothetical protein
MKKFHIVILVIVQLNSFVNNTIQIKTNNIDLKNQPYLIGVRNSAYKELAYTRLTGHYQLLMSLSLEECWNKCVSDSRCNSITFLHGNRKPHHQLNCCFLIESANPIRSRDDEIYFTSFVRLDPK